MTDTWDWGTQDYTPPPENYTPNDPGDPMMQDYVPPPDDIVPNYEPPPDNYQPELDFDAIIQAVLNKHAKNSLTDANNAAKQALFDGDVTGALIAWVATLVKSGASYPDAIEQATQALIDLGVTPEIAQMAVEDFQDSQEGEAFESIETPGDPQIEDEDENIEDLTETEESNSSYATVERPIWDEFVDRWLGVPAYENTQAQSNFANYFANASPGDTQEFAGGTLTMGENGTAEYISPTGQVTHFTASTPLEEIYNSVPEIAETWDQAYPTSTAYDAITGHADFMGGEAGIHSNVLGGLISDAEGGTGLFTPINYRLAGQATNFVPGANRNLANQIAQFSADRYGTAGARSPYAGVLSYLSALPSAVGLENDVVGQNMNYDLGLLGIDLGQQDIDLQQPGWLDKFLGAIAMIQGGGNTLASAYNAITNNQG